MFSLGMSTEKLLYTTELFQKKKRPGLRSLGGKGPDIRLKSPLR